MQNQESLRVERVKIEGLFGLYDHDVPLNSEERVTIVHGPNGVGKTALLRLVSSLLGGQYLDSTKYPFKAVEIALSVGVLRFSRKSVKGEKGSDRALHADYRVGSVRHGDDIEISAGRMVEYLERFGEPWLIRVAEDRWLDRQSGEELTASEVYARYGDQWRLENPRRKLPFPEPEWLISLRKRTKVHLIETQRLLRMGARDRLRHPRGELAILPTVRDYARDLSEQIKNVLSRYGAESQTLDQSFPQRLLGMAAQHGQPSSEQLKERMTLINDKRAELQRIGLLDATTMTPFDVTSMDALAATQSAVMSLYVEDTERKLAVFEDLAARIRILLTNINQKFRNKRIRIEREKGFVALGDKDVELDPDALSSGEQHELVLLYDLLFRVPKGALVLIDEPELSLHVTWQKRFLPDLVEIVKTAELDAIVATHSPFIVGDRLELMVALGGESEP